MLLRMKKDSKWNFENMDDEAERIDQSFSVGDRFSVFVYGHPYLKDGGWIEAKGIKEIRRECEPQHIVEKLGGSYAIAILDSREESCEIIIDPFKIYNFFYTETDEEITISDSLATLIAEIGLKEYDEQGVLEYLSFHHPLGDKTIIKDAKTLRSGTITTVDNNLEKNTDVYWEYKETGEQEDVSAYVEAFNEHMQHGLSLSDKISLPLSGGLDSRTVLSACLDQKEKLHCFTYGLAEVDDVKIAKKICEELDIEHEHYPVDEEIVEKIPEDHAQISNITDGVMNSIQSTLSFNCIKNESKEREVLFSGVGGEQRRCYVPMSAQETTSSLAKKLRKRVQDRDLTCFLADEYRDTNEKLDEAVEKELEKADSKNPLFQTEYFYITNRIGKLSSVGIRLLGRHLKIFNPYLVPDVLEITERLEEEKKLDVIPQRDVIISNSTLLTDIPLDLGRHVNKDDFMAAFRSKVAKLIRQSKNIANEIFKKNIFVSVNVDYPKKLRETNPSFVKNNLIYDDLILKEMFQKEELENMVDRFLAGEDKWLKLITKLISLETWLRKNMPSKREKA